MRSFDLPLNDLVSVLRTRAQLHPMRTAIDFLGDGECVTETINYGELDARAQALAATLQQWIIPGDRVLLLFPSGLEYVVAFVACLYAGAIAVPVYPPETGQPQALKRLVSIVEDAQPALALTDVPGVEALSRHGITEPGIRVVVTTPYPAIAQEWRPHATLPGDIAFLQYTSGSTAAPKGVIVTHRHLVANKHALSFSYEETSQDRYLSWLPLFHDMGLILGLLQPLFYGLPLVLMSPKRFLERPRRWLEAIARYRATISGGPDFAYRVCAERIRPEAIAGIDLSCWRVAFSGAEPVRHTTLNAFTQFAQPLGFNPRALHPCYGLAEATLFVSGGKSGTGAKCHTFNAPALARGIAQPEPGGTVLAACGRTAWRHRVCIVAPDTGRALPDRQIGEIWVAGPTVAGGYWNNESATSAAFNAFHSDGDGPFLRTGDLGFVSDGELYISSRLKDLIILRGRNFYPQDLEREIEACVPGVRPGRVAAFAVEENGAEAIGIAAEAARVKGGDSDPAAVIAAIQSVVAEAFGEPVSVVALLKPGALPKTTSGKLQRSECRAGWLEGTLDLVASYQAKQDRAFVPPCTQTEKYLAALWAELLDCAAIGARDNFFMLGGQSLLVAQLAARVEANFGVALPLNQYFTTATLSDLAALIDQAPQRSRWASLPVRGDSTAAPASFAQRRLWFLQSLEPDSAFYHVAVGLAFSRQPVMQRLRMALDTLIERHEALRTVFSETDQGVLQSVCAEFPFPLVCVDVDDGEQESSEHIGNFVAQPFDLSKGPLIRALLLNSPAQSRLILAAHHIAVDGWSLKVLLQELAAVYAGTALAPSLQYADFALWQQNEFTGRMPMWIDSWRERLAGAPGLTTLPPDFQRPASQSHRGASLRFELPAKLIMQLEHLAGTQRTTLFMTLFAGYAAVLAEFSGQIDLVIGTDIANRHYPGTASIVGFFVNQLPIRCRVRPSMTGIELFAAVRETLLAAYANQDLPFDKLVEALRPSRSLAHAPVFQTKFVFQDAPPAVALAPDLNVAAFTLDRNTAELDLLFDLVRHTDGLSVRVEYATDLYRAETIARFAERFTTRLETFVAAPQAALFQETVRRPVGRRAAHAIPKENAE